MTDTAKMTAVELRERLAALAAGQVEIISLLHEITVKQIVDATTGDVICDNVEAIAAHTPALRPPAPRGSVRNAPPTYRQRR